ncbi:unnamed protein product, partial [Rotaria magnacalcarata]
PSLNHAISLSSSSNLIQQHSSSSSSNLTQQRLSSSSSNLVRQPSISILSCSNIYTKCS